MTSKKKKAPAAQNLIDSLLDEKTPTKSPSPDAFDPQAFIDSLEVEAGLDKADERQVKEVRERTSTNSFDLEAPVSSDLSLDASTLVLGKNPGHEAPAHDDRTAEAAKMEKTLRIEDYLAAKRVTAPSEDETVAPAKPATKVGNSSRREERIDPLGPTELRTGFKASSSFASPAAFSSAEASLKQSESLRIAQARITELEHELDRIRRENEQLVTAGETLRRRTDELLSRTENSDMNAKEAQKMVEEEKKVFRGQLQQKDRENLELRGRLEEMEGRLESNFKKIRVRERELEHRLEIIKMESATLVSTKDKMILDLKRQIDQLAHENDYAKQKTQELFGQYKDKQDTVRRVVRALRIALTILEGDEDASPSPLKKVD